MEKRGRIEGNHSVRSLGLIRTCTPVSKLPRFALGRVERADADLSFVLGLIYSSLSACYFFNRDGYHFRRAGGNTRRQCCWSACLLGSFSFLARTHSSRCAASTQSLPPSLFPPGFKGRTLHPCSGTDGIDGPSSG